MGQCQQKEKTGKVDMVEGTAAAQETNITKDDGPIVKEDNSNSNSNLPKKEAEPAKKAEPAKEANPVKEPEQAPGGDFVTVHIAGCRGSREVSWTPKTGSDLYIVVRTEDSDDELHRTKPTRDEVWPMWQEEVQIPCKPGQNLEFEMMEVLYDTYDIKGQIKKEQTLVAGRGVLKSEDFASRGFNGTVLMDSRIHADTLLRVRVRPRGQEYPQDPPSEFTVELDRADGIQQELGLKVDKTDGTTLCIREVEGGLVGKHNAKVDEGLRIRPRDFITMVNDTSGNAEEMMKEIKSEKLTLMIKRPMEIAFGIPPKQPRTLHGIQFGAEQAYEWLLVTGIEPNKNCAWYNEAHPENQLKAGDRMVRAFGTTAGFGCDVARTARYSTGLQCVVFRPFDWAHPASCWTNIRRMV